MSSDLEQVLTTMAEDELLELLDRVSRLRSSASEATLAPETLPGEEVSDPDNVETLRGTHGTAAATVVLAEPERPSFADEDQSTGQVQRLVANEEPAPETENRYQTLAVLGEGGMGTVMRVRDLHLNRRVAMKVLKPRLLKSRGALARFKEEAQIAAQLQHPGIIPVHDIGRRPDGSVFFTMKEVKGKTFEDVIDDVQIALEDGKQRTDDGWSFRRVIDVFHRVCETVAYAHHRGVVHRDLKPENIMVGAFGEVLVLDWGLAKVLAEEAAEEEEVLVTDRTSGSRIRTRMGAVAGTPSFMAPEQARGQIHRISPATDVYGLGGILYAILTGRLVYMEPTLQGLLDAVAEGQPKVPAHQVAETPGPVPEELSQIAMRALAHRQEERYPDARALAEDVAAWLDGARKREKALEIVGETTSRMHRIPALLEEAGAAEARAIGLLADIPEDAPLEARHPAWELEARAREARREAAMLELEVRQGLRSALSHAPDLPEAHDALADRFFEAHRKAEAEGGVEKAAELELDLRAHDRRGRYATYLRGDGAVNLVTDPPGAEVVLYEHVERHKRLVPVHRRSLGITPLLGVSLPRGSWLLKIRAPGHEEVVYPVSIGRQEHWDGVPPGASEPFPIVLPAQGSLGPEDCYVPAGWFGSGAEDPRQAHPLPRRRLWCHPMVFRRFPVTFAELGEAAVDLMARGEVENAQRLFPEDRGHPLLGVEDGRAVLRPDPEGGLPDWRWPALLITYEGVETWLAWYRERTGMPWRLPHELEWEKAARGVDERLFSWGNQPEALLSSTLRPQPDPVESFPTDVSVYGLRQISGGILTWLRDRSPEGRPPEGHRVTTGPTHPDLQMLCRGGSWADNLHANRAINRRQGGRPRRGARVGFRLVRSLSEKV